MAIPLWLIPMLAQGASAGMGIASKAKEAKRLSHMKPPADQFAGLMPQARAGMQQQLTGRPDQGLLDAQSAAVRAPFLAAQRATSRGAGFNPGSNMRQQFLGQQAAAVAKARARTFEGAAQGKRSALQQIVGQRPSDLERMMRFNMLRAGVPGRAEAGLAAGAEGASDMGKLSLLMQLLGSSGGG